MSEEDERQPPGMAEESRETSDTDADSIKSKVLWVSFLFDRINFLFTSNGFSLLKYQNQTNGQVMISLNFLTKKEETPFPLCLSSLKTTRDEDKRKVNREKW